LRRGAYPRGGRTRRLAGRPLTGRSPAPGGAQDRHSPFPRFMLWSTSRMPGSDSDSNYRSALVVVPHWLMALVVPTVPVVTAPTASVRTLAHTPLSTQDRNHPTMFPRPLHPKHHYPVPLGSQDCIGGLSAQVASEVGDSEGDGAP